MPSKMGLCCFVEFTPDSKELTQVYFFKTR